MRKLTRLFLALGAFFVLGAGLVACGGGVPGDAVARVGDASITKDQFNHWLTIAAKSGQQQGGSAQVPDPPDFKACIANLTKSVPKPAKGQPAPSPAQFKSQCKQQYDQLRDQVMQFLVNSQWIEGEAKADNITVTDADVRKQFDQAKKQAFPKGEADYQRFLKQSGMSEADILFRFRQDLLKKRLTEKITKGKTTVTDQQVTAYYNAHKQQFGQPERRDLLIVLTKTSARAAAAKKALQGGASFKAVAKKYSIDQQTKATGGLLAGAVKGQDPSLDRVAFTAPKGKLQGPVKAQFGYYVFQVKKITPAKQQPLEAVKANIRQQLMQQGSQAALNKFQTDFKKKWIAKTDCRKAYEVADLCKNAPKAKPGQAAPGQGVPQQGAPQQVPQQGAPQQGAPQQVPQQGAPQQGAPQQVPQQGAPPSGG